MRNFTASVIIAAVSLGTPAFVQAQGTPWQRGGTNPACSVQHDHPEHTGCRHQGPETGSALEGRRRGRAHKRGRFTSLRKSIDATPAAAAALKAKGLSSSHVVAINIADGVLTMFARIT